jgi:small subunit ribosomal protein S13
VRILRFARACIVKHIELRSYKGLRYENKLPVNGQRTRTNARTCKRLLK